MAKDQQPRSGSNTPGTSTPVLKVANATGGSSSSGGGYQPPSSPTNSEASFLDQEPNPTAALLEALSKTDKATAPPSPKTQRQLALVPSEPRVPPIVRKAIELLDQKAVKTEGLFRISGSKARIDEVSLGVGCGKRKCYKVEEGSGRKEMGEEEDEVVWWECVRTSLDITSGCEACPGFV